MFELQSERQAYLEVLLHESKKVVRMVRAFPVHSLHHRHPDCGMTAIDLAGAFVRHVRRIEELASGRPAGSPFAAERTRGGLLMEFELALESTCSVLTRQSAERWADVIDAPADLAPWRQGRRGELLWMALRELSRHSRHFARHLSDSREDDGGREPDLTPVLATDGR